jgi:uncharacterized protein YjcR
MPSLEAKLAEALNEARNLRTALEREIQERQRDHDVIIKLGEQVKTLFKRVGELETEKKDTGARRWEVVVAFLTGVIGILVALATKFLGGKS